LRLLGTVGEPINPEAWIWYQKVVGGGRCPIVDTWWQTETGSIMMTTLPVPLLRSPVDRPALLRRRGRRRHQEGKSVVPDRRGRSSRLDEALPSMLRTIWGDDERFKKQYWSDIPGAYFTGDGGRRDEDGYFWVVAASTTCSNVAGHRIAPLKIESALVSHAAVAEAAAVGRPDELKGQALVVFVTLKPGHKGRRRDEEAARRSVERENRKVRSSRRDPFFADALPRRAAADHATSSEDVAAGTEAKGDTSTLEDLTVTPPRAVRVDR